MNQDFKVKISGSSKFEVTETEVKVRAIAIAIKLQNNPLTGIRVRVSSQSVEFLKSLSSLFYETFVFIKDFDLSDNTCQYLFVYQNLCYFYVCFI